MQELYLFFCQKASETMEKTILPIKQKLAKTVHELETEYDSLMQETEKMALTKASYLTGLQKLKALLDQLVPLVPEHHTAIAKHKLISRLIPKLTEEIQEEEEQSRERNGNQSDPSSPIKEQSTRSELDSSVQKMTLAFTRAEAERANQEIRQFVAKSKTIIQEGQQAVTSPAAMKSIPSQYLKNMVELIAEANGIFLTLSEQISATNLTQLNDTYHALRTLGASLFRLCIEIPQTEKAKILTPFYDLVTLEDFQRALEHTHRFLIEFFIKDCQIPVEQWAVTIRGQSYPSAFHYLISEPNDETVQLLILLIANGVSILSQDLSIIQTLFTSDDPKLKTAMLQPPVQKFTVGDKEFCNTLTARLRFEANPQLSEMDRQRILTLLKRHTRVSAAEASQQKEIESSGSLYEEQLKLVITPSYEAAYNTERVKELRRFTAQQIKLLIPRLSSTCANLGEVAQFEK